jgi:hypothetical protein
MEKRTCQVCIRLRPQELEQLRELAGESDRSLSATVALLIREAATAAGFLAAANSMEQEMIPKNVLDIHSSR